MRKPHRSKRFPHVIADDKLTRTAPPPCEAHPPNRADRHPGPPQGAESSSTAQQRFRTRRGAFIPPADRPSGLGYDHPIRGRIMITLFSYPELFGVADNNGYGLKIFAFLKLADLPFVHQHIFDASAAPRGQLPYIIDDGKAIGDSDTIIAHLTRKYGIAIDDGLTAAQRDTSHLVTRLLDDLYWVMSYSRWKDEQYWPAFRDALRWEHPSLTEEGLLKAKEFNAQRYHYQGIGRFTPTDAYARGLADLQVLANLIPADGYVHGANPASIDAGIYGFLANIYFYPINTPLRQFIDAHANLIHHCTAIHALVATGQ
jgi:glutathione S-transferase